MDSKYETRINQLREARSKSSLGGGEDKSAKQHQQDH